MPWSLLPTLLAAGCSPAAESTSDSGSSCASSCAEDQVCEAGQCLDQECVCHCSCECTSHSSTGTLTAAGPCPEGMGCNAVCIEECDGLMNGNSGTCDTEPIYPEPPEESCDSPTGKYSGKAFGHLNNLWEGTREIAECEGTASLTAGNGRTTGSFDCVDGRQEYTCGAQFAAVGVESTASLDVTCTISGVKVQVEMPFAFGVGSDCGVNANSDAVDVNDSELGDFTLSFYFYTDRG